MENKKEKQSGVLKTMSSALIYGFTPTLCAATYALGNNFATMTFFRNLLVVPVTLAVLLLKHKKWRLGLSDFIKILITANLGALFTTLLLYSSYHYISIGMATTIHFMYPVLVVLLCRIFFGEKVTKRQLCSICLALAGITSFLTGDCSGGMKGILLAFGSSVTFALYLVLMDRLKLSGMEGYRYSFWIALIASAELFLGNLKGGYLIFRQPPANYAVMLAVSLSASLLATILLKEGVRILGSSMASFISLLEPVSSIVFGMILLGETVTKNQAIGCILIIISIINLTGGFQIRKRSKA